jgi:hypothetical protein
MRLNSSTAFDTGRRIFSARSAVTPEDAAKQITLLTTWIIQALMISEV